MTTDATREEAVAWAIKNQCDFKTPVRPAPEGWMWAAAGEVLVLTSIFTMENPGGDITAEHCKAFS